MQRITMRGRPEVTGRVLQRHDHTDGDGHAWTTVLGVVLDPEEGDEELFYAGFWDASKACADAPEVDLRDVEAGGSFETGLGARVAASCYDAGWPHEIPGEYPPRLDPPGRDDDGVCPECETPLPEYGECDVCGWDDEEW